MIHQSLKVTALLSALTVAPATFAGMGMGGMGMGGMGGMGGTGFRSFSRVQFITVPVSSVNSGVVAAPTATPAVMVLDGDDFYGSAPTANNVTAGNVIRVSDDGYRVVSGVLPTSNVGVRSFRRGFDFD